MYADVLKSSTLSDKQILRQFIIPLIRDNPDPPFESR